MQIFDQHLTKIIRILDLFTDFRWDDVISNFLCHYYLRILMVDNVLQRVNFAHIQKKEFLAFIAYSIGQHVAEIF